MVDVQLKMHDTSIATAYEECRVPTILIPQSIFYQRHVLLQITYHLRFILVKKLYDPTSQSNYVEAISFINCQYYIGESKFQRSIFSFN